MKNLSLYSARFRVIEAVGYLILLVPWVPDLLQGRGLPYGTLSLAVKLILTAAVLGFIFILRDVRRKINSLDILKQDLALSAIHDLKGPLTSIIGALAVIAETDMEPATRDKLLELAARDSKSMVRLIQVLVDTERMETAKLILDPRRMALGDQINECVGFFSSISADLGIKLTSSFAKLPPVCADKDLLGRVLQNLVMNAFKYSRRGGEINIAAAFSEGLFRVEVRDTGTGIAAEHIKKVFEKYYRVEGQEQESRKGSGLGLYFCRLAVEAHGGRIWVENTEGHGAKIIFTLPEVCSSLSNGGLTR